MVNYTFTRVTIVPIAEAVGQLSTVPVRARPGLARRGLPCTDLYSHTISWFVTFPGWQK